MQRGDGAGVTSLSEPEYRGIAGAETTRARDLDQCGDSGAVSNVAECGHRRRRESLHARRRIVLIDVFAHRPRSASPGESHERRHDLRIAEQAEPLNCLATSLLCATVITRERSQLRNDVAGVG